MYRFILRLNKSDLDIIALSEDEGFKGAVKNALYAFVSGKKFVYTMPAILPRTEKTAARISFTFNETEDSAIIDFLSSIKDGAKNSVVLMIIRSALPFPVVSPYLDDDGVFYEIFVNRKKRGRKRSNQMSVLGSSTSVTPDPIPQPTPIPPVVVEPVQEVIQQAAIPTVPDTPASVPIRPSLVAAVEKEQAADKEEQTKQTTTESTDSETDSFDPFAFGTNMMEAF